MPRERRAQIRRLAPAVVSDHHQPSLFSPRIARLGFDLTRGPSADWSAIERIEVEFRDHDIPNAEAGIYLARHIDGRWMWSTQVCFDRIVFGGQRPSPIWGCFAPTRAEALGAAIEDVPVMIEAALKLADRNRHRPGWSLPAHPWQAAAIDRLLGWAEALSLLPPAAEPV